MLINGKDPYEKYQDRNLSDVFKELKETRNSSVYKKVYAKKHKYKKRHNIGIPSFSFPKLNFKVPDFSVSQIKTAVAHIKLIHIMLIFSIVAVCMAILLTKNVFAQSNDSDKIYYELNDNALDMKTIICENSNASTYKEQIELERDVNFETLYQDNSSLPKGEEVITQEGVLGKDKITAVKTYENETLVEEVLVSSERIQDPTPQIVDVGTSEFLASINAHINDTLYLTKDGTLRESADTNSNTVVGIKKYLDVKLLELTSEEWCKVSYDNKEGYIQTSYLTSSVATPTMPEKCRIQKILQGVDENIELNKKSTLTLEDYKKIFTGISSDTNKIFQDNYETFYNVEQNYNVNGLFIAAIAIHESGWGTSQIAKDKHNLFGYGAYDRDPYEYSYEFESYAEGIETVAKVMAKYYLNPAGTKIYDNETAKGSYYSGATLADVNKKYASDENWHTKVYSYMELLYGRLKSSL